MLSFPLGGSQFILILLCNSLIYGPKSGSLIASIPGRPPPPPGLPPPEPEPPPLPEPLPVPVPVPVPLEVEEPEKEYWRKEKQDPKPFKYKLTIVWGVVLLILGIVAIYYSNRYRNHYAFECETFLVDEKAGIYHLDWNSDCSIAEEAEELEKMQGYQIDEKFKFCEECQECLEEVESEAGLVHARL